MATQKRKHHREDDRVGQGSGEAGLTRSNHTTRTWGEGQEKTWTEGQEEGSGHEQIGLGEYDTQRLGDETVHQEEHERVEEHGGWGSLAVHELDVFASGGDEYTWAECEKKGGRDGNFLGSDIGQHFNISIYIFS